MLWKDKYDLSTSDKILLKYAARGLTNEEIGKKMYISEHTVKAHLARIFKQYGVNNKASAVYIAAKLHLI